MFNPSPPGAGSWFTPTGPSAASAATAGDADTARWDQYMAAVKDAMTQSSGWEREKLRRQLEDAQKGRDNAYRLAQLQAQTSRYGTDQQTMVNLRQLQENARQFDANHGLEQAKYGLGVAEAYTKYASGPDMMFMRGDFLHGLERAGQGLGPSPYGSQGTPVARGWEDFAALAGFGNMPGVQSGGGGGGGGNQSSGGGGGGGGGDPRMSAISAINKAIPPSSGSGLNDDDFAALSAIESVRKASLPGSFERMRPGQQQAFSAGLSRMGYFAPDALADMRRSAPGQGSARSA